MNRITALPNTLPGFDNLGRTHLSVSPGLVGTFDVELAGLTLETGFQTEDAALLRASAYACYGQQLVEGVADRVEWILTRSSASSEANTHRIRALNNARRKEVGLNLGRGSSIVVFQHLGLWWETVVRIDRDEAGFLMEETTDDWLVSVCGDRGPWVSGNSVVECFKDWQYEELVAKAIAISKENL